MNSSDAYIQIDNELNKLSSGDYPNIEANQIQEAVNKAALVWVRRQLHGGNQYREGTESSITRVDDLQVLLKPAKLSGSNKDIYFQSTKLPSDYMRISRVTPICNKDNCISIRLPSHLKEDSNVDDYLSDWDYSPSFDFEQTFHIMAGNKIRQYHNNDFEVKELDISYYTIPQFIQFEGAILPSGGIGKDMTWQFKEDVAQEIISETIEILAGSIESYNRQALSEKEKEENN